MADTPGVTDPLDDADAMVRFKPPQDREEDVAHAQALVQIDQARSLRSIAESLELIAQILDQVGIKVYDA